MGLRCIQKENEPYTVSSGMNHEYRLLLVFAWILVLAWRIYVMVRYSFHYVDGDQAIMWYATVHYAHGHFPEPCFFILDTVSS